MAFPTYERQNKWINDFIAPIVIDGDVKQAITNYKANRHATELQRFEDAGVFAALERMDCEGSAEEQVMNGMREQIVEAKRKQDREAWNRLVSAYRMQDSPLFGDHIEGLYLGRSFNQIEDRIMHFSRQEPKRVGISDAAKKGLHHLLTDGLIA